MLVACWLDSYCETRDPVLDTDAFEWFEKITEEWCQCSERTRQIPEKEWPSRLHFLRARNVTVAENGVFIQFGSGYVKSWGVFVLPHESNFQPQTDSDPSFHHLHGRVYRFEQKA